MQSLQGRRLSLSQALADRRSRSGIALVPFIPAGFPDLATTRAALPALERGGAAAIEIGFPFTDPIADGPIIQGAFVEALSRKLRIGEVLAAVAQTRGDVSVPIVGMLSYSIVYRYGADRFFSEAKSAGFDALILPDLPPPQAEEATAAIRAAGLDTIFLIAPTTSADRRRQIVKMASGFIYYLSVSGITGERDNLPGDLDENVRQIKTLTHLPVCVGFGVSKARHVAQLAGVADGAIIGTAMVRRMASVREQGAEAIARELEVYCRELLGAASD